MPMQPRPRADTSRLLFPSFRFCMDTILSLSGFGALTLPAPYQYFAVLSPSAHIPTARFINISDILHVSKTFFAVRFWFLVVEHAVGEIIPFCHELRRIFVRIRFIDGRLALDLRLQVQ